MVSPYMTETFVVLVSLKRFALVDIVELRGMDTVNQDSLGIELQK